MNSLNCCDSVAFTFRNKEHKQIYVEMKELCNKIYWKVSIMCHCNWHMLKDGFSEATMEECMSQIKEGFHAAEE